MTAALGSPGLGPVDLSWKHGTGEAMAWRILTCSHGQRTTSKSEWDTKAPLGGMGSIQRGTLAVGLGLCSLHTSNRIFGSGND